MSLRSSSFTAATYRPRLSDVRHVTTFNKGTGYTEKEREELHLRGLLPPRVETLEEQKPRTLKQFRSFGTNMERYVYLSALKNINETLFYSTVLSNLKESMPVIYTPTVGEACKRFGHEYRVAQGMYFSPGDKGHMRRMLDNWPISDVSIIVVTDGSRILGLGDLGANGMGIPIGKLSLYVAGAGFPPASTLPVMLDLGTDNQELLDDPLYLGRRHKRLTGDAYLELVDEFVAAVYDKWPEVLVQFEDFSTAHAFDLLERYRYKHLTFNDDIQGTGAVVLSGYINSMRVLDLAAKDNRLVFHGAGSAGVGVADMIVSYFVEKGLTEKEARRKFWFVDSRGLVTTNRGDKLASHKVPYARDDVDEQIKDLKDVIAYVKPTSLIGLSGMGGAFSKEVIDELIKHTERPIIMALSNPTANAECSAEQAYTWTNGKAIFASGSPFDPVTINGKTLVPGQGNNMFIFPGLGFGAYVSKSSQVSQAMIVAASKALADSVSDEHIANGDIYPDIDDIRSISVAVAVAVIRTSIKEGFSTLDVADDELAHWVEQQMYVPSYGTANL